MKLQTVWGTSSQKKRDIKNAQWRFVRAFFGIPIHRMSRKRLRKWKRHKRRENQNAFRDLKEIHAIPVDDYHRMYEGYW